MVLDVKRRAAAAPRPTVSRVARYTALGQVFPIRINVKYTAFYIKSGIADCSSMNLKLVFGDWSSHGPRAYAWPMTLTVRRVSAFFTRPSSLHPIDRGMM